MATARGSGVSRRAMLGFTGVILPLTSGCVVREGSDPQPEVSEPEAADAQQEESKLPQDRKRAAG